MPRHASLTRTANVDITRASSYVADDADLSGLEGGNDLWHAGAECLTNESIQLWELRTKEYAELIGTD